MNLHELKFWLTMAASLLFLGVNAQMVFETRISNGNDDVEQRRGSPTGPFQMYMTSSDIELVNDGGSRPQRVGLRFQDVRVPKGAYITGAYIQFTTDETDAGTTNVYIRAEAIDDALPYNSVNDTDVSDRTYTSDSIAWLNIPAWNTVGEAGPDQRTPDLTSLVNEVISRPGWTSGNVMAFTMYGTGERTAESYNGTPGSAPKLVIEYFKVATVQINSVNDDAEEDASNGSMYLTSSDLEFTTDGSTPQVIGMRFPGLQVPTKAVIDSAFIEFQVDEADTGSSVSVVFAAELEDNASPFTSSTANISNRNFGLTNVAFWTNIPFYGTVGAKVNSPDLSSLLQQVVDRNGWVAGNALVIGATDPFTLQVPGFTGNSGNRTFESGDGPDGPVLKVFYEDPSFAPTGSFPVNQNSTWSWFADSVNPGTSWTMQNFNDSLWNFGPGVLGYGDSQTTSTDFGPDPNNKYITTYFRHTFFEADASQFDSLIFSLLCDDGAVVYLNGVEQFRYNMPSGAVDSSTLASSAISGMDETTYFEFRLDNIDLVSGLNTLAVEVHQAGPTSSDKSFDLQLIGKLPPIQVTNYPINKFSEWSYNDLGVDLDSAWRQLGFNDANWAYGSGILGYGDPVTTTLSFGSDANNKYPTYYFRKKFDIPNIAALDDTVKMGLLRDDGAVVYINGVEVVRSNMPSGAISYSTSATNAQGGSNEDTYFFYPIPKTYLVQGTNIIAVEVHQISGTSSDMSFDLELIDLPPLPGVAGGCQGPNDTHFSCFTSINPATQDALMHIPASHDFQVLAETGDAYTVNKPGSAGMPTTVGGLNDFTAFVSENNSSTQGWVHINHETTPGGVTYLDVHLDQTTGLWVVDSSQAVDFYDTDLTTTARNCSGGVTPWGTTVSAEETTPTTDANGDGYIDAGWLVEIVPQTKRVRDYGNGREKLWAMGRMSHENVCFRPDSLTAYYAEDRGNGAVYKFVANAKGNFTSGSLYALDLAGSIVNGEPTSSNGIWIPINNTTQTERNTTNALAAAAGATGWSGPEDVEINPVTGDIYFTSKGYDRTYRFTDDGSTISNFMTFVGGQNYFLNHGSGIADEPWGSGNDNLVFDDRGNLYVLQDGDRDHVWMVRPGHTQAAPQVEIFVRTPAGSEPCGMHFTPDFKYAFLSIQHPSGANSSATQTDASGYVAEMSTNTTVVIARKEFLGTVLATDDEVIQRRLPVQVYPNPSSHDLNIALEMPNAGQLSISILSADGKEVLNVTDENRSKGVQLINVPASKLSDMKGLFLIQVQMNDRITTKKVIIR